MKRNLANSKVALISYLRDLEDINVKIDVERNTAKKYKLLQERKNSIDTIKKLTTHLNSVGKMSDKETRAVMSLDLMTMKEFPFKFNLKNTRKRECLCMEGV